MRPHLLPQKPQNTPCGTECPCAAEAAQRWQDIGGIEGFSLEWMLDRARAPQEALT